MRSAKGKRHLIKNPTAEADQFQRRAAIGFLGIALLIGGLCFGGYFRLQVLQHEEYQTRSEANRIKPRPVVPARGLIYDRKGRLLADNVPAYRLEVVPNETDGIQQTLVELGRLISISPEEMQAFEANRKATKAFRPVVLKLRLSEDERARLAVNRYRFPGVDVVPYLTRRYPYGELFAHVVGYVGRLDVDDLEQLGDSKYSALTHIGKSGLERKYENELRGEIGYENVEQNVEGRVLRVVNNTPSEPGADLQLSIDVDLQRAAVNAFGDRDGAVVAMDPRTGEVLAMVSKPMFDPNLFVNGISRKDYTRLTSDLSVPLFDRNLHGGTAPGSTVKPFMGLAGLDAGLRKPSDRILSTGTWRINGRGRAFGDAHKNGHGWVDLKQSIAQSVNTYYYQLAMDMGVTRFDEYMSKFGFGQPSGIDLVGETNGILPSPEYKKKRWKQDWYAGDLANSGIGQGLWKVDMLQLASALGGLANNGARHQLHLVRATRQGYEAPWLPTPQPPAKPISDSQEHMAIIRDAMVAVVHGPTGTARAIGINAPYIMGGKTGTAQVVSNKNNLRLDPHSLPLNLRHQSLFIAFAPAESPRIVVAVVVEHGGFGAAAAAPIARQIMDAWLVPQLTPPGGGAPPPVATPGASPTAVPGQPRPPRPAPMPPPIQPIVPAPAPPLEPPPDDGEEDDTGTTPP